MSVKRVTLSFEPSSKIDLKSEFHLRVSRVGSCGTESVGVNFSQMKNPPLEHRAGETSTGEVHVKQDVTSTATTQVRQCYFSTLSSTDLENMYNTYP